MRRIYAAAVLTTLIATLGCSKAKKDVALENAAEACAAMKGFMAGYYSDCLGYTTEAASALVAADPGMDCAAWTAAVADQTTTYDRAKATACLDVISVYSCNDILWAYTSGEELLPYECMEAMTGSLLPNDPCEHDFECVSGICDFPVGCGAPGACADAPGLGEACAGTAPYCAGGLVCDAGVCAVPPPFPAPVAVGGDCSAAPCVNTAYCRASDTLCVARPTDGMACSASNPCAWDARCIGSVCQKIVPVGGACTFGDTACETGASCVNVTTMAAATTCQRWGGAGAQCGWVLAAGPTLEFVDCVDAWCDAAFLAVGSCNAWTPVGDPCTAGTGECGPDNGYACTGGVCERLYCDPTP